jgi:uncharacterized protein (DUF2249 family)
VISGDTTVAALLAAHPELIDILAGCHPHFEHLRNRVLRRVMAPRVTVAQAARMAGVAPGDLLAALRRAVGEPTADDSEFPGAAPPAAPPKPAALDVVPEARRVRLDVRDAIHRGEEPFGLIMRAVKRLREDEVLVLRAPFEPVPLYQVLARRGFRHWTECRAASDWSVWFYRAPGGEATTESVREAAAPGRSPGDEAVRIDVRGLEPPEPMVRVLEQLDALAPGRHLEVLHDRRPMFLYPQLDASGFVHETDEPELGLVRIRIRRGASA